MGFNKRYLPELPELKKIRERFDSAEEFLKYLVGKSDALIGSSDSMAYISELEQEVINTRIQNGNRGTES